MDPLAELGSRGPCSGDVPTPHPPPPPSDGGAPPFGLCYPFLALCSLIFPPVQALNDAPAIGRKKVQTVEFLGVVRHSCLVQNLREGAKPPASHGTALGVPQFGRFPNSKAVTTRNANHPAGAILPNPTNSRNASSSSLHGQSREPMSGPKFDHESVASFNRRKDY